MNQYLKLFAVGAAAVVAAEFVEESDWYGKSLAEAKAEAAKAGQDVAKMGEPLMLRGARYGAGAAVIIAAKKLGFIG